MKPMPQTPTNDLYDHLSALASSAVVNVIVLNNAFSSVSQR